MDKEKVMQFLQLQTVTPNPNFQRKYKSKQKHSVNHSIANQTAIADVIQHLYKTGVSISSYQAFMELANNILPKDNQINLSNNHDELGASLHINIELKNTNIEECLQWHDKLLQQWTINKDFDLNILFDVMPSTEVLA